MKKVFLLLAVLLPMFMNCANAQNNNVDERLLHKAEQAYFDDDDDSKAFEYVNDFLDSYPNHADGRYIRARIYYSNDKNDAAIRDLKVAVKNHTKNSRVYLSTLYDFIACVYADSDQMDMAIEYQQKAVKEAKKDNPDKFLSCVFDLGQYYYNNDQLGEAETVYLSILKEDNTYQPAMVGLARNCLDRKEYDKGLEWLELAKKYDDDYAQIYRFEMQIYKAMGKDIEAVDSAIKYCITNEDASINTLTEYIGLRYSYGIAKLEETFRKTPTDMRLPLIMARMHKEHGNYNKAIDCLKIIESEYGASATLSYEISMCYDDKGDFPKAIAEINKAIEKSEKGKYIGVRADLYRSWGKYNEAIADYMEAKQYRPTEGHYYYGIGWSYELMGNDAEAMKYYNEGMEIDPSQAYLAVSRADLSKKMGMLAQAEADYKRVLENDKEPEIGSCRQYALIGLGRNDEAIEWMDKIIASNPEYAGCYYDKACVLGRIGRYDEALDALETAFKKGFRRFNHLVHDDDMDCLRNFPRYKALVNEYKGKDVKDGEAMEDGKVSAILEPKESVIPLKRMAGGTYEVPCSINKLPLRFIFDTGASDITISSVEANFMLKNNYLSKNDFKGTRNYLNASGEITEGAVICLKEITIGDVVLKNVNASVVKNQKAPLLLGQTALERFGSFTIDNESQNLIIKY